MRKFFYIVIFLFTIFTFAVFASERSAIACNACGTCEWAFEKVWEIREETNEDRERGIFRYEISFLKELLQEIQGCLECERVCRPGNMYEVRIWVGEKQETRIYLGSEIRRCVNTTILSILEDLKNMKSPKPIYDRFR